MFKERRKKSVGKGKNAFFPRKGGGEKAYIPFRKMEKYVPIDGNFRYHGIKIPLLRSQISVSAEPNFRYHGGKFPLVRKNNSFARPGPSLPWPLSPSALRPFLSRGVKFFRKKPPRPLACPVKVLTFAPAFRKGGAPGGGRGGPGKKVPGCGKKVWRFRRKRLPLQPVSPGAGEPREGRKFRSRGREERSLKELEATQAREAGKEGSLPACRAACAARRGSGDKNQFYNEEFDPGSG